jgi:starvation-inducible DNA-binding protein
MPVEDLDLARALDQTTADLINLSLVAKHAHWNLVGPGFGSLHLLLDELADVAREGGDRVAERSMTLGRNPDGRPETVAERNSLTSLDAGPINDAEMIDSFGPILEIVTTRLFASISASSCDLITQGVFIDVAERLERLAWMIRAHTR